MGCAPSTGTKVNLTPHNNEDDNKLSILPTQQQISNTPKPDIADIYGAELSEDEYVYGADLPVKQVGGLKNDESEPNRSENKAVITQHVNKNVLFDKNEKGECSRTASLGDVNSAISNITTIMQRKQSQDDLYLVNGTSFANFGNKECKMKYNNNHNAAVLTNDNNKQLKNSGISVNEDFPIDKEINMIYGTELPDQTDEDFKENKAKRDKMYIPALERNMQDATSMPLNKQLNSSLKKGSVNEIKSIEEEINMIYGTELPDQTDEDFKENKAKRDKMYIPALERNMQDATSIPINKQLNVSRKKGSVNEIQPIEEEINMIYGTELPDQTDEDFIENKAKRDKMYIPALERNMQDATAIPINKQLNGFLKKGSLNEIQTIEEEINMIYGTELPDQTDEDFEENKVKRDRMYIPALERNMQDATKIPNNSLLGKGT